MQFHSCLSQQQSLLQDYLRITTYQRAILINETDFRDKVTVCAHKRLDTHVIISGDSVCYRVLMNNIDGRHIISSVIEQT